MYSYVCSLGLRCHPAMLLKNNEFKKCSFPFDWVLSEPKVIIDCLENNFSNFLDKSNYISRTTRLCGHKLYHEKFFRHRNPMINNEDYEYYNRCVSRFKKLLEKKDNKLFVIFFINNSYNDYKDSLIKLNETLKKYTENFTLLSINNIRNKKQSYKIIKNENIHLLEINTLSKTTGLEFINKEDDIYLSKIIKDNYQFDLKTDI